MGLQLASISLAGARLDGANLRGAMLSGSNLSNASLVDTDMRNISAERVGLLGARTAGADLRGAYNIPSYELLRAMDLRGAIMPSGHRYFYDCPPYQLSRKQVEALNAPYVKVEGPRG